jgi:hypothetical protein
MDNLEERVRNLECWVNNIRTRILPLGPYTPGQVLGINDNGEVAWLDSNIITNPSPDSYVAKWGWNTTGELPTFDEITDFPGEGTFEDGEDVVANFAGSTIPRYLIMAEPLTTDIKTRWYVNDLVQEVINNASTFRVLGYVDGYRVYMTAFATQFTQPVRFKLT